MSLALVTYTSDDYIRWDAFCDGADNATFLHSRRFLSYHGNRFVDQSLLICDGDQLIGVLAAAVSPIDPRQVISHPGITYGGIVHRGRLAGPRMIEALKLIQACYRDRGFSSFIYKAVPHIYARIPAQDDLYALFRLGAERMRCDLSSTIDLHTRREPSQRRRRGLKKAGRFVHISDAMEHLGAFWCVLTDNLQRKHQAVPVHSLLELETIADLFPEDIQLRTALLGDKILAGVLLFCCSNVWHAQYIASSEAGYEACALDAIFEAIIQEANSAGVRYFDFGVSTESGGAVLNEGLYRFKSEFGGGGIVHEFYKLPLVL